MSKKTDKQEYFYTRVWNIIKCAGIYSQDTIISRKQVYQDLEDNLTVEESAGKIIKVYNLKWETEL